MGRSVMSGFGSNREIEARLEDEIELGQLWQWTRVQIAGSMETDE